MGASLGAAGIHCGQEVATPVGKGVSPPELRWAARVVGDDDVDEIRLGGRPDDDGLQPLDGLGIETASRTPGTSLMALASLSITSRRRPSLTFGTHSTSRDTPEA